MKKVCIFLVCIFGLFPVIVFAQPLSEKLAGRILLQVENNGEAWYVGPDNLMRYFLGRPTDAFELMRDQGVGISNEDLKRIPIGVLTNTNVDSDQDGLSNDLETALGTSLDLSDTDQDGFSDKEEVENGYNPLGSGVQPISISFANKYKGKIFLQVEKNGEAWYINPANSRRYFLGRPVDAFNIMRDLGLGITNENLESILVRTPNYSLVSIEEAIHGLINQERVQEKLSSLSWNDSVAQVARRHSQELAKENQNLTDFDTTCDYPLIHHEGIEFGPNNKERLNLENVYYFSRSGENIALMPGISSKGALNPPKDTQEKIAQCQENRQNFDDDLTFALDNEEDITKKIELIQGDIQTREQAMQKEMEIELYEIAWSTQEDLAKKTVAGWMNSPGHKKNILNKEYNEAGIGAAYVNGYVIITQSFITRAECGFKNGSCCEKEGYYPYCFVPLECREMVCY